MARGRQWRVIGRLPVDSLTQGSPVRRGGTVTREIFNQDESKSEAKANFSISVSYLNRCDMER